MVHVIEHGRDFTTFENVSHSKSFLLRQHSHQYCLFHLTEFEESKHCNCSIFQNATLLLFVMHTREEKTLLFV